jgi:hypothetical protein
MRSHSSPPLAVRLASSSGASRVGARRALAFAIVAPLAGVIF